jgi:hypothetical protein
MCVDDGGERGIWWTGCNAREEDSVGAPSGEDDEGKRARDTLGAGRAEEVGEGPSGEKRA